MTVYLCKGDFEHILCGVYDAWMSRKGHKNVRLALEGETFQPSFLEEYVRDSYINFQSKKEYSSQKIDPQLETNKLIKQFDEIIDSDLTTEDLLTMYERHVISQMMRKQKELDTIIQETEVLGKLKNISDIQKVEQLFALKKRFRNIQNNLTKIKPFEPPKPIDKSIDTNLIRKFKTAIQDDNYNLDKVYIDYYSDLNGIKKVEQLPNKYPKLKVPQKAEDVIAEKVIATFTRDFYEKLDKLMIPHNEEKVFNFCNKKIMDTLAISTKEPEKVYDKAFEAIITHILQKYQSLIKTDSFSTIPEFRKNKTAQITDTDLKLLSVDYDDFVLTVLRKQHLENKKLNEITYTDGNITIPIASLKENYYKFEKTPEKIKAMIKSAKQIQAAKRDYEHFNNEKLKERLNYYTNQEIGNNEDIFNLIVAFDSCNFGEEDKKALIKFLQTLDDVKDGKISEVSAVEYLKKLDIRPKEPNSYKFESFIFDAFEFFDDIAILRGKREDDFAPVKNKEGVDSPRTAKELYEKYWNRQ